MEDIDTTDPLELMVAAAMSRQYREDSRSFLKSLARLLEPLLPGAVQVQRVGWFGGADRAVKQLNVSLRDPEEPLNNIRYAIEDSGSGELIATRGRIVRGITLKTETIAAEDWVNEVSIALARQSASSKATRDALRRLAE